MNPTGIFRQQFLLFFFSVYSTVSAFGVVWPQSVTYSDRSRLGDSFALVMEADSVQPSMIHGYNWYPSASLYVPKSSQVWDDSLGFWDNSQGEWTGGEWRIAKVFTNINCEGPWDSLSEYYDNVALNFDEYENPLPPFEPIEVEIYRWFGPVFIPLPAWVSSPGWRTVTSLVVQETCELVYGEMSYDAASNAYNFKKYSQLYVIDEYGVSALLDETISQINSLKVDPYSLFFSNPDFYFTFNPDFITAFEPFDITQNWESVMHQFSLDIVIEPPAFADLSPSYVAGLKVHQEIVIWHNRLNSQNLKVLDEFTLGSTKAPSVALFAVSTSALQLNFQGVLISGLLYGYFAPYIMPTLTTWENIPGVGSGTQGFMDNDSTVDVFLSGTAWTSLNLASAFIDSSIDWDYTIYVGDMSADTLHGLIQGTHKQYPSYTLRCDGVVVYYFQQGSAGLLGLNASIVPLFPVNISF